MKKENLIEIARSFSYKKNLGNYQVADFFCSAKKEVPEEDAEKTSEALYQFAKKEVVKSLNEFERNGLSEPRPISVPVSQEDPEGWKTMKDAVKEKLENEQYKPEPGDSDKQNKFG